MINWLEASLLPTEVKVLVSLGAKSREKVQHEVKWVVLYNNRHAKLPNLSEHRT